MTHFHHWTNLQPNHKHTHSLELWGRLLKKPLRRVASHSMLSCRLARAFRSLTSLRISFWGISLSPRFPVKTSDSLANATLRETDEEIMNICVLTCAFPSSPSHNHSRSWCWASQAHSDEWCSSKSIKSVFSLTSSTTGLWWMWEKKIHAAHFWAL